MLFRCDIVLHYSHPIADATGEAICLSCLCAGMLSCAGFSHLTEGNEMKTFVSLLAAAFLLCTGHLVFADDTAYKAEQKMNNATEKAGEKVEQGGKKVERGGKKLQKKAQEERAEDKAEHDAKKAQEAQHPDH